MQELIDTDFKAVKTPAQACDHYLPKITSGEMDLMAVKRELREKHNFEEEDVRITARVLSNEHMRHTMNNSGKSNAYFSLIVGIVVLLAGIGLTLYLWNRGFIAGVALFVVGFGFVMLIKSITTLGK